MTFQMGEDLMSLGQRISRTTVHQVLSCHLLSANERVSQIISLCFCGRFIQLRTHVLHRNTQTGSPFLSVTKSGPKQALSTLSSFLGVAEGQD